ncbi:spore germination protein KA [Paenibacillus sp. UNCCL117]|uniref:spore germination protein n=1 Tax=unclassified Paenibacillus TaxID=185978 RepID=UPI000882E8B6|nr:MULTISPECIES: spore germination protein [unclassified Paenibacillus]SDE32905.1 spore germination protein KA [Paenibacillus sp. cl123]SFW63901.1 spore germination protein KA [Paenibacillus sp. UNCCL117]
MNLLQRFIQAVAPKPSAAQEKQGSAKPALPPSGDAQADLQRLAAMLGSSMEIKVRSFSIGGSPSIRAGLIYSDGLADKQTVQQFILNALMLESAESAFPPCPASGGDVLGCVKDRLLAVSELRQVTDLNEACQAVLSGDTALLIDSAKVVLIAGTRSWKDRAIEEPVTESVIRGPRDGFTETLLTNTALIRRRLKSPKLKTEILTIGEVSHTDVALMYLEGTSDEQTLQELRTRIKRISSDAVLASGAIEEFIQDEQFTPFPTVYNTERPDNICSGILGGRIAIIVDGTPFVLLVPCLFQDFYQSAEDYNQRADSVSLTRLLRLLSFFTALLGPSAYIAITTFHQEMLPTELLISLASSREGIPFPAFVEALLMEIIFEILREASVRMPRIIGPTMSIVGALVLGQASIQAGLVSPAMIIVVAITAITNFVIPSYSMAISIRMLRFFFMVLSAVFGLFGILFGLVFIVQHLCSLRSLGTPYMAPYAPLSISKLKDSFLMRAPWRVLTSGSSSKPK